MNPALELRGIDLGYGSNRVVYDASLVVYAGTVHALAGENGSGKSTLLAALSGRLAAWAGEIFVNGQAQQFGSPRDAIAAGVALVSQELSLVAELSIAENLAIGSYRGRRRLYRRDAVATDVARFVEMVGLDLPVSTLVAELTTHQRQLVEIARALATGARIILLDEPTSSLDLAEVDKLFACISSLREQGYTFVLITHRSRELHAIADVVTVLRDGRIIGTRPTGEVTEGWLVTSLVGREMNTLFPERHRPTARPVLEVRGLADMDGCLTGADLDVRAGEIVVLSGLVGAGRTELLESIYGARRRAGGTVTVESDVLSGNPADSLRRGVAMIFEERKRQGIVPALSNADNFAMTSPPRALAPRRAERTVFATWRAKLGIKGSGGQSIERLSGGNQQKVLLARALAHAPRVLLLDEPTRGVDVGAKADIYRAIADAADAGCAVLLTTSEMEEALGLADRILVLREGRIIAELDADSATEETIISAATGLRVADRTRTEYTHV